MLVVISPAKKLDWSEREGATTAPAFQSNACELAQTARNLSVAELKKLMHLSDNLAQLNHDRFANFQDMPSQEATRAAIFGFAGDTYQGLEANSLDADELSWAQDHLRILSGLYGALKPLDAIQPYRLEMGSRLQNAHGKNLYAYWGDLIANALNAQAQEVNAKCLINCASQEYFSAVDLEALEIPVLTPAFMEDKGDGPKIVSFFAKKARGAMARFVVQNRILEPEGILEFDAGGYQYQPQLSSKEKPVFTRPYPVK